MSQEVVVQSIGSGLAQDIVIGHHRLMADEPPKDAGPNPYELLLAALGSCKAMTLQMYAARKQWPLQQVTVRLRHSRIHAEDCQDCETREGLLDHIDCAIELSGPLTEEQRTRLLEIADKCPVHRTLTAEIQIRTTLAGEQ